MKYVSMDIEAGGLNPNDDLVFEIALVVEDTAAPEQRDVDELPYWRGKIFHKTVYGHPVALTMNADLIAEMATPDILAEPEWYESLDNACHAARRFLSEQYGYGPGLQHLKYVAAGKNVAGFDMQFMPPLFKKCFAHRVIDAGSAALGGENRWWKGDRPPSLGDLTGRPVAHNALGDARDVIRVLREVTGNYGRVGND